MVEDMQKTAQLVSAAITTRVEVAKLAIGYQGAGEEESASSGGRSKTAYAENCRTDPPHHHPRTADGRG